MGQNRIAINNPKNQSTPQIVTHFSPEVCWSRSRQTHLCPIV